MTRNRDDIEQAAKLFEQFTGDDAAEAVRVEYPAHKTLTFVGMVDFIGYTAVRDGVTERYKHTFKKHARPALAVSPDGKQLYMLAGAYTFTARGIVDDDTGE
jgi:hypothetical protein